MKKISRKGEGWEIVSSYNFLSDFQSFNDESWIMIHNILPSSRSACNGVIWVQKKASVEIKKAHLSEPQHLIGLNFYKKSNWMNALLPSWPEENNLFLGP